MLLQQKSAVIHGAGGASEVDAFSESAVEEHAARIGPVDISFNAVGLDHHMGRPLLDLTEDEFLTPFTARIRTNYLTARAAARQLVAASKPGVLLMITATPARTPESFATSFGPACAAVEGLARSFAAELGPHGIRVVNLRSAGACDSPGVVAAMRAHAAGWIAGEALATAVYCFLLHPADPVAARSRAAYSSGDSDSVACLTGAFAAAAYGMDVWPAHWNVEYADELTRIGREWD